MRKTGLDAENKMINSGYVFILLSSLFTVMGELLIKWRIDNLKFTLEGAPINKVFSLIILLFDKIVILGLSSALIADLFWMAALSKFNLSHAYPIFAASLTFFTVLSAIIFLSEKVNFTQIVGTSIVIIGLIVLYFGNVLVKGN